MRLFLCNIFFVITFATADRIELQTVRQGYSEDLSATLISSENILNRNKMDKLKFEELPNVKSERWLDTKDLLGEVWKDAFENGFYQVSNYGRFKSVKRIVPNHNGNHVLKERIMKPCVTKNGYLAHSMRPYGKSMTKTIHMLVWESFYGKVPEGYEINHIDENKFNNTLENLNILKHKDNVNWGTHNARMAKTLSKTHRLARKVEQIKDGKVVATFCSIAECERQTGINHRPISACCLGKRKTHKGYEWRFIE